MSFVAFLALGIGSGTLGTLVGAGGGFILVPVLLFLYPDMAAVNVTAISLAAVFMNATSGSIAFAKQRKIDYRIGMAFALASIPGAFLGVTLVDRIDRPTFSAIFSAFLFALSLWLIVQPKRITSSEKPSAPTAAPITLGVLISTVIGLISSLLGIGGGILHVPALMGILKMPIHAAIATAQFILLFTAMSGLIVHLWRGTLTEVVHIALPIAIGAVIGAQLGARLASRIRGPQLVRLMAGVLALVAIRLALTAFQSTT